MLRSRDGAEDVLQETFLRLWRSRQMYRSGAMFRPYLYAVARNVIKDRQREMARTDSQRSSSAAQTAQDHEQENTERVEALQRAISELPELERSVLILAKFQRLSYREIS